MHIIRREKVASSSHPTLQTRTQYEKNDFVGMVGQKGFVSIPDNDDEVLVVDAFNSRLHSFSIGVIEPITYKNLLPGDRMIITNKAQLLLRADGSIKLAGGAITIDGNGGVINIENASRINLNGNTKKIARVGDTVTSNVIDDNDAVVYTG